MDKIKLCTLKSVYFTFFHVRIFRKQATTKGARIAQSVEHQTFNLRVQGSSPCSGGGYFKTLKQIEMCPHHSLR